MIEPSRDPKAPQPQFKGVWVCAALWDDVELNPTEKFLIAEVDSLCGNGKACFASNEFLAKRLQATPKYMNNMLYGLTRDGYLVRLAFTGRQTLRCVHPLLSSNPAVVHDLLKQYNVHRPEGESWESRPHKKVKAELRVHKKVKAEFTPMERQTSQKCEPEISIRDTSIRKNEDEERAREQAQDNPSAPEEASSSSFSFEGSSFQDSERYRTSEEAAIKKEKATDNLIPVAAVLDDGEDHTEELALMAADFGITEAQKRQLAVYAKREGIDYVREKAEVTCSEPRDNLARTFMAALKGDWTLPRSSAPKPEKRPIEQEIYGWRDTLRRLYPEADVDAQYPSWGALARDSTMLEELKAAHAAEKAAQDAVAEARADRLKQMWLEASEDQRKRWIAASDYHKKSSVPTDGTLPSPLVMAWFAPVMLSLDAAQATGKLEAAA